MAGSPLKRARKQGVRLDDGSVIAFPRMPRVADLPPGWRHFSAGQKIGHAGGRISRKSGFRLGEDFGKFYDDHPKHDVVGDLAKAGLFRKAADEIKAILEAEGVADMPLGVAFERLPAQPQSPASVRHSRGWHPTRGRGLSTAGP